MAGGLRQPRRACSDPFSSKIWSMGAGAWRKVARRALFLLLFLYLKGLNQRFVCFVVAILVIFKAFPSQEMC